MPEYSLDKENIRREQEKDDFCTKENPGDFSSKYEFFRDKDGVMYRRRPQEKHQVVIPKTLIQKVLKENHDQKYAAHPGIKRTYDLISLKYWWPGMRRFIGGYIKKCDSCQRRKAKLRKFHTGNLVYLFNPSVKPGLSRKFHKVWSGPFRITAKISDLNYEIVDPNNRKQIVHVNRLKPAYNPDSWKPTVKQKAKRKVRNKPPAPTEEEEIRIGPFPLVLQTPKENATDHLPPPDQNPHTPATTPQTLTPPASEHRDPEYLPSDTPKSRREMQPTRIEPPMTRSRTRVVP